MTRGRPESGIGMAGVPMGYTYEKTDWGRTGHGRTGLRAGPWCSPPYRHRTDVGPYRLESAHLHASRRRNAIKRCHEARAEQMALLASGTSKLSAISRSGRFVPEWYAIRPYWVARGL